MGLLGCQVSHRADALVTSISDIEYNLLSVAHPMNAGASARWTNVAHERDRFRIQHPSYWQDIAAHPPSEHAMSVPGAGSTNRGRSRLGQCAFFTASVSHELHGVKPKHTERVMREPVTIPAGTLFVLYM